MCDRLTRGQRLVGDAIDGSRDLLPRSRTMWLPTSVIGIGIAVTCLSASLVNFLPSCFLAANFSKNGALKISPMDPLGKWPDPTAGRLLDAVPQCRCPNWCARYPSEADDSRTAAPVVAVVYRGRTKLWRRHVCRPRRLQCDGWLGSRNGEHRQQSCDSQLVLLRPYSRAGHVR